VCLCVCVFVRVFVDSAEADVTTFGKKGGHVKVSMHGDSGDGDVERHNADGM